jgi:hypothetical protein
MNRIPPEPDATIPVEPVPPKYPTNGSAAVTARSSPEPLASHEDVNHN